MFFMTVVRKCFYTHNKYMSVHGIVLIFTTGKMWSVRRSVYYMVLKVNR